MASHDTQEKWPRSFRAAAEGTAWACMVTVMHYASPATNFNHFLMWVITVFAAWLIVSALAEEFST